MQRRHWNAHQLINGRVIEDENTDSRKSFQEIADDLGLFPGGPVMLPDPNVEDLGDKWCRSGRGTVVEIDLKRGEILVLTSSNSLVYIGLERLNNVKNGSE